MSALNKEPVKRAKEALKKFNSEIKVIELVYCLGMKKIFFFV